MYRKLFFKNKGVLSRKFIASGLAAVFSLGMFSSYAVAMQGHNLEFIHYIKEDELLSFVLNEPSLAPNVEKLKDKRWILENFFDEEYLDKNFNELSSVIPDYEEILKMYIADFRSEYKNAGLKQLKQGLKDIFPEKLPEWIKSLPKKVKLLSLL